MSSNTSESKQDADSAGTHASRPGNTIPAGVSTKHSSTAPVVDTSAHVNNDSSLSGSVNNSLDGVAQQTSTTQSVTNQMPSAHQATHAMKSAASSLLAGIRNLAHAHPESHQARDANDLHIPGGFTSTTSDREDMADAQRGLQPVSDALSSTQATKGTIPSIGSPSTSGNRSAGTISEQAPAHSVHGQVQQGVDKPENDQIHKDGINYIKSQLKYRNLNSVGSNSTTNSLAGQVPLEPRAAVSPQAVVDSQKQGDGPGPLDEDASSPLRTATQSQSARLRDVPQIVIDSQKKADVSTKPSANAEAVVDKARMEQEVKQEVPKQTSTDTTAVHLGQAISGGLAAAGAAISGAVTSARDATAERTGTDPVSILPVSAQRAIDGDQGQAISTQQAGAFPGVVVDSQQTAGVSSEASASREAVQDKTQVKQELQRQVPEQSASTGTAANLREAVVGRVAAAGTATAGAATYAREKTTEATGSDPVSVLPKSAQQAVDGNDNDITGRSAHVPSVVAESQRAAGVSPEASANLDDPQISTKADTSPQVADPTASVPAAHIPSFGAVDLTAGVKNTVVGSGADVRRH